MVGGVRIPFCRSNTLYTDQSNLAMLTATLNGLIDKYSLFVLEVVKAHVAKAPKYPRTVHYRGDGAFMIAGTNTSRIASSSGRRCCSVKPPCACAASAARGACFSSCCRQRLDARDP